MLCEWTRVLGNVRVYCLGCFARSEQKRDLFPFRLPPANCFPAIDCVLRHDESNTVRMWGKAHYERDDYEV